MRITHYPRVTNTYQKGIIHGFNDPNVQNGEFFIIWQPSNYFEDFPKAVDFISEMFGHTIELNETIIENENSPQDHHVKMCVVKKLNNPSDKEVGLILIQECNITKRSFLFYYYNEDSFSSQSYKNNGAVYFTTFHCHEMEASPLDNVLGYKYEKKD